MVNTLSVQQAVINRALPEICQLLAGLPNETTTDVQRVLVLTYGTPLQFAVRLMISPRPVGYDGAEVDGLGIFGFFSQIDRYLRRWNNLPLPSIGSAEQAEADSVRYRRWLSLDCPIPVCPTVLELTTGHIFDLPFGQTIEQLKKQLDDNQYDRIQNPQFVHLVRPADPYCSICHGQSRVLQNDRPVACRCVL